MRHRPLIMTLLAATLILVSVSFPIQIMWLYGHGPSETGAILSKLTSLNWMVMTCSIVAAALVIRVSSRLKWVIPVLIGFVVLNNFVVGYYAIDYSPMSATLASLGFALLHLPLLRSDIRSVLQDPQRRWWLRPARKQIAVPIVIEGPEQIELQAKTFDLSYSGAFIPATADLSVNERISICMKLGHYSEIKCEGRVVRKAEAKGSYPSGIGIEFVDLPANKKRELSRFLSDQSLDHSF